MHSRGTRMLTGGVAALQDAVQAEEEVTVAVPRAA